MKAEATLRYLRIAPRKVRMAADLVRGKKVEEAQRLLSFASKQSALPVLKTLRSAVASAKNNFEAEESNLYVSHIAVNEGPKLKRFRARARGAAYQIQKKTSHVVVEVDEIERRGTKAPAKKQPAAAETVPAPVRENAAPSRASKPKLRPEQGEAIKKRRGIADKIFRRKSI